MQVACLELFREDLKGCRQQRALAQALSAARSPLRRLRLNALRRFLREVYDLFYGAGDDAMFAPHVSGLRPVVAHCWAVLEHSHAQGASSSASVARPGPGPPAHAAFGGRGPSPPWAERGLALDILAGVAVHVRLWDFAAGGEVRWEAGEGGDDGDGRDGGDLWDGGDGVNGGGEDGVRVGINGKDQNGDADNDNDAADNDTATATATAAAAATTADATAAAADAEEEEGRVARTVDRTRRVALHVLRDTGAPREAVSSACVLLLGVLHAACCEDKLDAPPLVQEEWAAVVCAAQAVCRVAAGAVKGEGKAKAKGKGKEKGVGKRKGKGKGEGKSGEEGEGERKQEDRAFAAGSTGAAGGAVLDLLRFGHRHAESCRLAVSCSSLSKDTKRHLVGSTSGYYEERGARGGERGIGGLDGRGRGGEGGGIA